MTNRNVWTQDEKQTLVSLINKATTNASGIKAAAKKLGRTEKACSQKYYAHMKAHKLPKTTSKPVQVVDNGFAKVICHNGVSRDAMVVVQRKDLIVAKYDDLVITIEL